MRLSESVNPINYLINHTAEVLRDVSEGQRTIAITRQGEAIAMIQDIARYEQTRNRWHYSIFRPKLLSMILRRMRITY
ncbi:MAG: type II toxin-antitoxin system Phd/YefM family antitoxin [Candidatus Thiodiazotropha sp. (ex Cardiolucina cf. quadrata)]|nr:type II toxin-antitoxin system Phd/YefM family antitoxin [Candidatus Thiodiazotropha sp. (ex Cardiolucina cf. quadrata)]